MNCEKCNSRLNHLQIREVEKGEKQSEDLFRIDCFNPNCEHQNWIPRNAYFMLKKEITNIARKILPKPTYKLPCDEKVLMISEERSGSSWVAAHISIEHMKVFGILPKWNHECDRRYAVFKKVKTKDGIWEVVTPEGWTSVYDIDPRDALKKDFDKIILLEKPLDQLKEDIIKLNHPKKWLLKNGIKEYPKLLKDPQVKKDLDYINRLEKKIEKWWNIMFGEEFDDPRVYHMKLENLNNYTEMEWMKFCNWFGFPEYSQTHVFAVNRNWQKYSDVLPINYPIGMKIRQVEETDPNTMVHELFQEEVFLVRLKEEGKLWDEKKYPFVYNKNPYVRMPYETPENLIEPRSFRIVEPGIKDVLEEDTSRIDDKDFKKIKKHKKILKKKKNE